MAHAILAPSSGDVWGSSDGCAAAPAMQIGRPDKSGDDAKLGTSMHSVSAHCLETGVDAPALVGREFDGIELDDEHAETVQSGYIDPIRAIAAGGELMVEQRLPITHITGEPDAYGTSDAVIIIGDLLIIADLKYGMGVQVDAPGNRQLAIYAHAALTEFAMLYDIKRVRMMIFQPRLDHVSEWEVTVDELEAIIADVRERAKRAFSLVEESQILGTDCLPDDAFNPTMDNCRFCKAKGDCKAQTQFVLNTVADDFVDVTRDIGVQIEAATERVKNSDGYHVATLMPHIDMIESWCKAVRARAEAELHAGRDIPGYKLVMGKQGNRKWVDADEAEATLKSMRLKHDQMYRYNLISPTQAEKVLSENPRRWAKLQSHITRSPGSPTVVPASDKRSAIVIKPAEDDFEALL